MPDYWEEAKTKYEAYNVASTREKHLEAEATERIKKEFHVTFGQVPVDEYKPYMVSFTFAGYPVNAWQRDGKWAVRVAGQPIFSEYASIEFSMYPENQMALYGACLEAVRIYLKRKVQEGEYSLR